MTPTPEGQLTGSEIWVPEQETNDDKKTYRVELIMKRRVVVEVKAHDEEEACLVAQDVYATGDSGKFNELILGPDATVEEIK